jgi:hypothetical protein
VASRFSHYILLAVAVVVVALVARWLQARRAARSGIAAPGAAPAEQTYDGRAPAAGERD